MKVAILGSGAYGLALACAFQKNNNKIHIWSKFKEEIDELTTDYTTNKLPGIKIPNDFYFTTNLKECVDNSDITVIAVPIAAVRDTILELKKYITNKQHLCITSKGIEQKTNCFATDIINECIGFKNVAILSGPSFAIDVAKGVPTGLSLASKNKNTIQIIKKALQSDSIKIRETRDMKGLEVCGSIKNVIAIASGMIDGLGLPESTQAFLITESIHDIKYLIHELGGNKKTILSFAGVGDLFLTCTSSKSRNYTLGKMFGEKKDEQEIDEFIKNNTIEGLYTLTSIHSVINKNSIKLPIIDIIYSIIYKDKDPEILKNFLITKE